MNGIGWNVIVTFGRSAALIAGNVVLMAAGYGIIGLVVWFKAKHIPVARLDKGKGGYGEP